MEEQSELEAELVETYTTNRRSVAKEITAHINVLESGEWVGDFFTTFTKQRLGGTDKYVADWDSLKQGNGIYTDQEPCFWPVQEIAKELNEKYELQEFVALDTGKNDINERYTNLRRTQ